MKPQQISPGVWCLSLGFVNAYFIQNTDGSWVLVDAGLALSGKFVENAAEAQFGGRAPAAILLTHTHFDHAGGAFQLAKKWDVPVFVHRLEKPFVTGKATHPPQDPTVGGAIAFLSRAMPHPMFNLTGEVEVLPADGSVPGLPDWQVIETPGHSPGHVAFWNPQARVLIAGDALATADFDSWIGMITKAPKLARGGSPFNCDWDATRQSVEKLADLKPHIIGAGHGNPLTEGDVVGQMDEFARTFAPPPHGRYVEEPAITDESGVIFLPPAPPDPFARNAALAGAGLGVLALWRRSKKR